MRKFIALTILILFLALPVMAATNDFIANDNITVLSVSGDVTADMLIINGSAAESLTYSDGVFTVTNPGAFKIGSADAAVKSLLVKNSGGTTIACANNSTAGTSYVTLPTASATYTILPSTTNCTTLCTAITGVGTYYSNDGTYTTPTCGAATCASPYSLSATGSTTAYCTPPSSIVSRGGSSAPTATPAEPVTPAKSAEITPVATTPAVPTTTAVPVSYAEQWQNILIDAAAMSGGNLETILSAIGAARNIPVEIAATAKYTANLINGIKGLSTEAKNTLTNFITYGTPTTKKLGAGERAGVINSYKAAFNRVPVTEAEWKDAIAIGNGRWPAEKSAAAEAKAIIEFKKVYRRSPDLKQPNDNAAVTVISYGLRPSVRNTNSEKAAIKSFRAIYGYAPKSAMAWDIVRAIAYSGAKR